jgi:hypothetical protein
MKKKEKFKEVLIIINNYFKRLECAIFGHVYKYYSHFTQRSTGNDTGRRVCVNCGKFQMKTIKSPAEKLRLFLNKL